MKTNLKLRIELADKITAKLSKIKNPWYVVWLWRFTFPIWIICFISIILVNIIKYPFTKIYGIDEEKLRWIFNWSSKF